MAVKKPRPIRYFSECVRYSYKNESIARQLPAESQRCTKKVVLRTLKYRNKLLRQKYNWVFKREQVILIKAFFCRKTVPDHLTALLIPIPRLLKDPRSRACDPWSHITLRPWNSPISVKRSELEQSRVIIASYYQQTILTTLRIALKQCNRRNIVDRWNQETSELKIGYRNNEQQLPVFLSFWILNNWDLSNSNLNVTPFYGFHH